MPPTGDSRLSIRYDNVGRLWQIERPEDELIEYSYHGFDTPSQVGWLRRVEYRAADGTLQQGSEYTYDLLGRVQTVLELPTGDRVEVGYDGVGRSVSAVRVGNPSYVVTRIYQLDGQLEQEYVETNWEGQSNVVWRVYDYDEAGRLRGDYDLFGGTN